jgi:predicted O-methyltransferase YrrM
VINFFLFLKNLAFFPFSQLARHRLSAAYLMLTYPFFGNKYVELTELLKDEDLTVTLSPVKSRMHNITEFELLTICALVKEYRCNNIFEIGTFDGRTTRAMAMNLSKSDGRVYTLNLPAGTKNVSLATGVVDVSLASKVSSGERFLNTEQEKSIEQLWGDSAIYDFSPFFDKMDMVFIDGAHSEFYVENDTTIALKLVNQKGGLVMWHDAHLFGVVKYLVPLIKKNRLPIYFIKGTSVAVAGVKGGKIFDLKRKTPFESSSLS